MTDSDVQGVAFTRHGRGRQRRAGERRALIVGHVGDAQAFDELFLASGLPKSAAQTQWRGELPYAEPEQTRL